MANRYQPRTPPSNLSALEVNRQSREMYPDIAVGEESGISPEVLLSSIQDNLSGYREEIAGQRKFAVGAGKMGYVVGKDMGLFSKLKGGKGSADAKTAARPDLAKAIGTQWNKIAASPKLAGARNLGTGLKIGAKNVAAGTPFAGAGSSTTAASTMTSVGAAIPPLLVATAIAKLIGGTGTGRKWNKKTNKWLKKATGTGRTKNLLSPWKWRL